MSETRAIPYIKEAWEIARTIAAVDKQLLSSDAVKAFAKLAEMAHEIGEAGTRTLRPASEWTEADGPVLWWQKGSAVPHVGCYPGRVPVSAFLWWSPIPKAESPGERASEREGM